MCQSWTCDFSSQDGYSFCFGTFDQLIFFFGFPDRQSTGWFFRIRFRTPIWDGLPSPWMNWAAKTWSVLRWTWWTRWTWLSISDSSRRFPLWNTSATLRTFFPMASNESFLVLQSPNPWRGPSRNPSNLKAFWSAVASFLFSLDCSFGTRFISTHFFSKCTTWTRPWPWRVFLQCGKKWLAKNARNFELRCNKGKRDVFQPLTAPCNPSFGVATREFPFESYWSIQFKT